MSVNWAIGDCTVFPIYRPSVEFQTAKEYFSVKHGFYCYKYQTINSLSGDFMNIRGPYKGTIHDLKL
jgi:hypothetical protein